MEFLSIILILVYVYAGDQANYYLKYHIMGVRAEIYGNTGDYTLNRVIWAAILGWATIPLAILHYAFVNGDAKQRKYILMGVAAFVVVVGLYVSLKDEYRDYQYNKYRPQNQTNSVQKKKQEPKREEQQESDRKDTISDNKNYDLDGLVNEPGIETPVKLIDGKKYKLSTISTQEKGIIEAVEGKQSNEEISQFLRAVRIKRGGIPLGLTNSVIKPGRLLGSDDLRLGWIDIDEDMDSVNGKLGTPYKIENKGNNEMLYTYELEENKSYMEITTKNNKVDMIVSCGENITTPRGISASSKLIEGKNYEPTQRNDKFMTRSNVTSYYGIGYASTDYEDMELIEYTVNSKKGQPCILRFAVNKADKYIYYISIRHK